jgi:hypothetical protein
MDLDLYNRFKIYVKTQNKGKLQRKPRGSIILAIEECMRMYISGMRRKERMVTRAMNNIMIIEENLTDVVKKNDNKRPSGYNNLVLALIRKYSGAADNKTILSYANNLRIHGYLGDMDIFILRDKLKIPRFKKTIK